MKRMDRVVRILPRLPQLIGRHVSSRLEPVIDPFQPTHDEVKVLAERCSRFESEGLLSYAVYVLRR